MTKANITGTMFDICVDLARQSPCQKRGFGVVLMLDGSIVAKTYNHPVAEVTARMCSPRCVRFDIPSGSDSMIGACGHAEEHAIWECIRKYGSAKGAELWVAGVDGQGNPLVKTDPYFYCIRCATLMLYAEIAGVHTRANDEWHFLTAQEAYQSSLDFALKIRKA